ncbi:L-seryl-tRNA(Sec) selenium transferase, partial [Achromobacter sp. AGC25]
MAEDPPEGGVAAVSDIPPLDRLLNADALRAARETHGRTQVGATLRRDLDAQRQRALAGQLPRRDLEAPAVAGRVSAALDRAARPRL